jgi:serine/threonine-protein kinase
LVLFAVYRVARRESVGVDRLFTLQSLTYIAAAVTISLMAIHLGGVRSPYMHGISIVALVWAALEPTRWNRGLPVLASIGLAFPLVMGVTAGASTAHRAEWMTPEALVVFGSHYVFVVASSVLAVILSHLVWSAQQQARTFGSYELEELLGRGGMGEVWRARHQLLARRAAIKLIRSDALGGDAERRNLVIGRFEREAQATAALRSPHTISLYDFGVSDSGDFYYVMELLEGIDAEALVRRFGPMESERAVHLLRQACESLGEAHALGLVHRDIKPSNLFVCRHGREADFVKLLDFGLVKPRGGSGDVLLTADAMVSGTPSFMSPEQVLGDRQIDARSDVYALGCVAYWLLTGCRVFDGDTTLQIMMRHVREQPVPPSKRAEIAVSPELDELIMKCLEKDPSRRPIHADALGEALGHLRAENSWTQLRAREWWDLHHPRPA